MRTRAIFLAVFMALAGTANVASQSLGSGFTYQGTIADSGLPADGIYDFEFALYGAATGGTAIGTVTNDGIAVMGGLVNTVIDFGEQAFDGSVKYIEVRLRVTGSGDAYTTLLPRQALTGVPYALGLPMPFKRTVRTGAAAAFQITNADGGTAIAGNVLNDSGFAAIVGTSSESSAGIGVRGDTRSGTGVLGNADNRGTGVQGLSVSGVGVNGQAGATGGTGVRGSSPLGDGVRGLGAIGVHGVGNLGVWAEGGLLATHQTSCNTSAGACAGAVKTVVSIRNATIGNLIVASAGTPSTDVFRVNGNGSVFANGDYVASGADLAEYVPAAEGLEPGDVVEIDPSHARSLRMSVGPNSTTVAGVVSTRPGVTLNGSVAEEEAHSGMQRLALAGRVPVNITAENGAVRAGDLLVSSSSPGHAMRAPANPAAGTVIGKAMENLEGERGKIEMLVMLR